MKRLLLAVVLAVLSFSAHAVNPWKMDWRYSPTHGDFTVRYSYCVGWECPPPEDFGARPKIGQGWKEVTLVHTANGIEFYLNGVPTPFEEAKEDPFFAAALIMGWGFIGRVKEQTINGFKLVSVNLQGGYMADTQIKPGIHRTF